MNKKIKIILSGGGTMGSVSPMLAIRDQMIEQGLDSEFIWVGTEVGPERAVIEKEGLKYFYIKSGKLRRYFSLQNLIDPFKTLIGIFQSIGIIRKFKPDAILSAGGFVSVPLIIAGWLMKKQTYVHQQDLVPGLANKLMAKFATVVTVTFKNSLDDYKGVKEVHVTGNPVRPRLLSGDKGRGVELFDLEQDLPTLVVMGGSLGAQKINELIFNSVPKLIEFCQIIHIVGRGNLVEWTDKHEFGEKASRYHSFEYVHETLPDLYATADLLVCRAGLSTLTEIAALKKPSIIIPIKDNQQEANAEYFVKQNAIIYLKEDEIESEEFVRYVKGLFSGASLDNLSNNISAVMVEDAAAKYVQLILEKIA